jgi:hypothetical protein
MGGAVLRTGLAFFALGALLPLPGETAIDSTVYLSFFKEAAHQAVESHVVEKVNGEDVDAVQPSIQDAMDITSMEGASIVKLAAGCEDEIISLEKNASALIFESRLRAANEEKPTGDLANRLKELDDMRIQIVLDHVQRLKGSLGAERFKVIEDYIRSHANAGSFFPGNGPRKKL